MPEDTKDLSNIEKTRFAINEVTAQITKLQDMKEQLLLHLEMLEKT